MTFEPTLEFARQSDESDPLKSFRDRFHIPQLNGKDCYYFTGNSLGLQPKHTATVIADEMKAWAEKGVEGHFKGSAPWWTAHEELARKLSPIVGAGPDEIVVMNSLTVNLHLLLTTFYRPTKERFRILCEAKAFPSDQYAFESQVKLHGFDPKDAIIEVGPREGEHIIHTEDILSAIEQHRDSLALVLFGGINYYNGQVFDMEAITKAGQAAGAYVGFDLAHAAGNVRLRLHDWNVDFACWCSYKYLNSGPGGIAGAYLHERHARNTELPRLAGWWGYEKSTRFRMEPGFRPTPTAEGWQLSNQPVLLLAAHKAALEVFEQAGMEALHQKSEQLTGYLFYLLDELNTEAGRTLVEVITPRKPGMHGCQVSMLMTERGREVFEALMAEGVLPDWREPNVIRVAPVPLYNRYEDVWQFMQILRQQLMP